MFARIKEEIMWIGSVLCELIIVCTCNITSLSCTAAFKLPRAGTAGSLEHKHRAGWKLDQGSKPR